MSILGDNIKIYREKAGLDKSTLSKLSGVGLSTISQIESGVRENLKSDTVSKISTALNISTSDLLEANEGEYTVSDLYEAVELILSDEDICIDDLIMTQLEKEQVKFAMQLAINTIRSNRK